MLNLCSVKRIRVMLAIVRTKGLSRILFSRFHRLFVYLDKFQQKIEP